MINWGTPIEILNVDKNDILGNLQYHIMTNYDLNNPISDFGNDNLFNDKSAAIQNFKDKIVIPAFNNYILKNYNVDVSKDPNVFKCWITGTKNGYYMVSHNHSGAQFSGVFYLLAEEQNQGGSIIFTDPRYNANRGYDERFQKNFSPEILKPKTGDFVIFPSYLYHYVEQFKSSLRIALPIDMFLYFKK